MEESLKSSGEKIIDNLTSRLKIPIIATYVIVLGFQNWDIIYFIIFAKLDVIDKIHFLKINYTLLDYVCRVFGSLLYAIFLLILFTLIDYYLLKYLKDFSIGKKNIQEEINNFNILDDYKNKYEKTLIELNKCKKGNESLLKDKSSFADIIQDKDHIINSNILNSKLGEIIFEIRKKDFIISIDISTELLTEILSYLHNQDDNILISDLTNFIIKDSVNYNEKYKSQKIDILEYVSFLLNILLKLNYISMSNSNVINKNYDNLSYLYDIFIYNKTTPN